MPWLQSWSAKFSPPSSWHVYFWSTFPEPQGPTTSVSIPAIHRPPAPAPRQLRHTQHHLRRRPRLCHTHLLLDTPLHRQDIIHITLHRPMGLCLIPLPLPTPYCLTSHSTTRDLFIRLTSLQQPLSEDQQSWPSPWLISSFSFPCSALVWYFSENFVL